MHTIPEKELGMLRAALEKEQRDLESELAEHGRKVGTDWQGSAEGFQTQEADNTDTADKFEELATNVPLVETLERRLKDVNDAIEKMNSGTYGICEKTGEQIPLARLKVNPAAREHVEHSE